MAKSSKAKLFTWQGINKSGEKITGEVTAGTLALAKADLRSQGIIPKRVRKKSASLFSQRVKKITQGDIAVFSRQMATMLAAGIPLIQAFDIVCKGHSNPSMQKLVSELKNEVESGTTLSDTLKKHPKYFNDLYCNLIDAGEQSGSLDIMLDKVATYKEKTESLKRKIKKALYYPIAVVAVAFIVTTILLIYVVPQFESLFKGFGADLPTMTRMVVNLSEFFQAYWWLIFGIIIATVWGLIIARQRSPQVAQAIDRISLQIPVLGQILEKAAIARFARTLSITFAAGLPLVDALKSVAGATGNILYAKATLKIREVVSSGSQIQVALRQSKLFPNMMIQMVAIGEESGSLEDMLAKSASFYEEEVDAAVDGLSSLLEPLIMVVLGVLVGGLVIAMYLPIFKLGSVV